MSDSKRVLLVEDDVLVGEKLRGILEDEGYIIVGNTASGEKAIELTAELEPDVILMDVALADLDGLEATRRIMAQRPTPIIILTGHDPSEMMNKALDAGASCYISQPATRADIIQAIILATARFEDMMNIRRLKEQLQTEINERERMEAALREREAQYETLVERAPVGIFRTTSTGKVLDVNMRMAEMVGYETKEAAIHAYNDLAQEFYVDPDRRRAFIEELEEKGEVEGFEFEAYTRTGARIWISMNARISQRHPDGAFAIDGFAVDITERKQAEEALRKSEDRLKEAQQIAKMGSYETDLVNNYWEGSEEFLRIFGFTEQRRYTQEEFQALVHPDDFDEVMAVFDQRLAMGEPFDYEYRCLHRQTGAVIHISSQSRIIYNDAGQPVRVIGVKQDITERKRMEKMLRKRTTLLEHAITDLEPGDHLCCIYETEEEHRAVLTPYLRSGLERNEKVLYIVDAHTSEAVRGYLRDAGMEVETYLESGQLVFLTSRETYTRGDIFDPDAMIAMLRAETAQALEEGYAALRITGEMSWALRGLPGSERLIEYETKLNKFFPQQRALSICQYDRRRFGPEVLLDILRTHPIAVVGTEMYDNFYYVPPREMRVAKLPAVTLRHLLDSLAARKRVEEALRESERRLAQMLQTLVDGMVRVNTEGKITYANPAAEEILEIHRDEILKRYYHERSWRQIDADGTPYPQERLPLALALGKKQAVKGNEHGIEAPNGERKWLSVNAAPLIDEHGNLYGAIASFRDITERKRAEAQLQEYAENLEQMVEEKVRELEHERAKVIQAGKMAALGELATGVAHELSQPLMAIMFEGDYLKTLAERMQAADQDETPLLSAEELRETGEHLIGDVERCQRITNHLREFGHLSKDHHVPISLNQPIEDSFILMEKRLQQHNVVITRNLAPELPAIRANLYQLEQVFLNLISNAEHATEEMAQRIEAGEVEHPDYRRRLTISTYVDGDDVVAEVQDNGCGIPPEAQASLFEPFFTTKPVGKGTGLGLSISRDIVEECGGEITFTTEENVGTTFILRFPIAR